MIVLTGFAGTGKTAVGRSVAAVLGVPFLDLDDLVEKMAAKPIPDLFAAEGEEGFRRWERHAVRVAAGLHRGVLATGGGTLLSPVNRRLLAGAEALVCLSASPETIAGRLARSATPRPLLGDTPAVGAVRELYERRKALYDSLGPAVDTTGLTLEAATRAVLARLPAASLALAGSLVSATGRTSGRASGCPPGPGGVLLAVCFETGAGAGAARYPIHAGSGWLVEIGDGGASPALDDILAGLVWAGTGAMIVSEPLTAALFAKRLSESVRRVGARPTLVIIPPGERAKTMRTLGRLYTAMAAARLTRQSTVFALGGGTVGDVAGLAAATYMRGVDLVHVPTTLLAQVDSAVGGKTAINWRSGSELVKNLVGTFWSPRAVIADAGTLASLPAAAFRQGLAEAVKYGVVVDATLLTWLEENRGAILARDPVALTHLVAACCRIKATVVENDPFDRGERACLNFGHTLGHALEDTMGRASRHGDAVAAGMVAACRLAEERGLLTAAEVSRVRDLLRAFGLPVAAMARSRPPARDRSALLARLLADKKRAGPGLRMVLPDGLGRFTVVDDVAPGRLADLVETDQA